MELLSNQFKVGMYIRLSREDGDKMESESISNQRKILQRYIEDNNLLLVDEYVDDGVSGTTFDRPGFKKMLQDIENNRINMVITKDLSRLGRDYIKIGYYTENYFPEHKIRYAAINDGIDTFIDSMNNDITPFKAIVNDMYTKDISKKIRSVFKEKKKNGEYLCAVTAYGFKKDITTKNKLIKDDNTYQIVNDIFQMYKDGSGCTEIKNYLKEHCILSPSGYRKTGLVRSSVHDYPWNETTILNMLRNEVYIGNSVQNKTSIISYKVKKIRKNDESDYIIVKNTHEPIIEKELFDMVQNIVRERGKNSRKQYEYLLSGMMYCHHCGRKLQVVLKSNNRKNSVKHPYIVCSDSKERGCYPQNISYYKFEAYILECIKSIVTAFDNKTMLKTIYTKSNSKINKVKDRYEKEILTIDKKSKELQKNLDKIYFDKLNGVINEENYIRYSNMVETEIKAMHDKNKELKNKIIELKNTVISVPQKEEINQIISDFYGLKNIDKSYIFRLINKIEIDRFKNVYIHFTFNCFEHISLLSNNKELNLEYFLKNKDIKNEPNISA